MELKPVPAPTGFFISWDSSSQIPSQLIPALRPGSPRNHLRRLRPYPLMTLSNSPPTS